MPTLSACNIIRIYSNRKQNTRQHQIQMRENGGSLDFNFISLLNPAVDENWVCWHCLLQFICKNDAVYDVRTIQTFSVNGKFAESYIFCAWIDLFTIFVCSRYRLWATIRLLHHFGFVTCINSRLYCTHFSYHWRKIHNVSRQLMQISKRQRDPCVIHTSAMLPATDSCSLALGISVMELALQVCGR